ncbi:MAG: hypothetical protein ACLPKB_24760 [Xanthobacteraceae bacterium]
MRNPGGYFISTDPHPRRGRFACTEVDTFSCRHCNRVVFVQPMCDPSDMGGLCKVCMGYVCPRCAGTGRCDPLEAKLEREEARYHARRWMAEAAS